MSDSDKNDAELLKDLAAVQWGFMEDGLFFVLPKLPLIRAGYTKPPFDVTMSDGTVRHVFERIEKIEIDKIEGTKQEAKQLVAAPKVKVMHKIKVYTATKLNNATFIRNEIAQWPEIEVTSRWPFSHVDGDGPLWPEDCAAHGSIFWAHDEEDVRKCDVVLIFGYLDAQLKGALVEAGMALGMGKRVIVVGQDPAYSTWQFHPRVYRVKDMETARSLLTLLAVDLKA